MNDFFHQTLIDLACRIPTLLACVVGFTLSAAFWRRCPRSALLAMLAAILFAAATVAQSFGSQFLLTVEPPLDDEDMLLHGVDLVCESLYAVSLGLLFAAVLLGRSPRRSDFDDLHDDVRMHSDAPSDRPLNAGNAGRR
jgi:hypothetical protein